MNNTHVLGNRTTLLTFVTNPSRKTVDVRISRRHHLPAIQRISKDEARRWWTVAAKRRFALISVSVHA
tara:strand:+ start:179 stop:382 length:204 start_codon:yes stop_codon:yes gene_type:complete